jgi:hypothetical protein
MISKLAYSKDLYNVSLKERYIQSKIAKETYKSKQKTFIDKPMRAELKLIYTRLSNPTDFSLDTPISHVIDRDPDFISYGDASLDAGGGFVTNLFWWHTEWSPDIQAFTLKNLIITKKCKFTNELISINLLEFVIEIINYVAVSTYFQQHTPVSCNCFSVLLNWTDNKTAQAWIRKAATRTKKGKALQRILCSLMINNSLGFKADYIKGEHNILADAISRTVVSKNTSFSNLFQRFPHLQSWKRFIPSQELLSHLFSALLTGQDQGLVQIKNLGHFVQDNVTF